MKNFDYYRNKTLALLESGNHWDIEKAHTIVDEAGSNPNISKYEHEDLIEILNQTSECDW